MRSALYILLLVLGARPASGQSPDSVYSIGEITVTAARESILPEAASQRVVVFDGEEVRASAAGDVADLLEARAGLFIRRHGEGLATVSLRGGGSAQTLLLIDGVRLADPQLGQFDLSLLPTVAFGRVEVLHGPGSALYGTDGMAGVINLRRPRPESEAVHVVTRAGAYGERTASGRWTFSGGSLSGMVAAEYGRADGDFPYVNRALFPAREMRRQNADRQKRSLFGTLSTEVGPHHLRASILYADAERGLPGLAGTPPVGERQWDEHLRIWIEDRVGVLRLKGFVHRGAVRYRHPPLDIDDVGRTWVGGLEGEYRHAGGPHWQITSGASAGYASAAHPSLSRKPRELHAAAFLSGRATFGRIAIYPDVRADAYTLTVGETTPAISPRLGVNVKPSPNLPVHLKANAARGFRVPTFNQRFWQPGGNPALRPERSRSLDGGIHARAGSSTLELTGYISETRDQIVWVNQGGDVWSPRNLTRVWARGIELSADLAPARTWAAGLVYVYTRAIDRSDAGTRSYGRQLRYVPMHQTKAHLNLSLGPVDLFVNGRYVGLRFVTSDESESLDPAVVVDANVGLTHRLGSVTARLSVGMENALDTRYAVVKDYPMPPRHAWIALAIEMPSN